MDLGFLGFQWLGGSFVENIEVLEGRDPGDIDVVTFLSVPDSLAAIQATLTPKPELVQRKHVKTAFLLDHFWLPLCSKPTEIVDQTRYWYGLFSHRRDQQWKGMLSVQLIDKVDDEAARKSLGAAS